MKFHCDSCNARYSIPDERVRGKVLKVRCKSCSAIITVREDAEPEAPESAAQAPGAPVAPSAVVADVDWYMSIGGEQTGPMKLPVATAWVAKQAPGVEIYCWYDGFGDWKPVTEVAAFAGARPRPSQPIAAPAARPGSAPPPPPPGKLAAPAPTIVPTLRPSSIPQPPPQASAARPVSGPAPRSTSAAPAARPGTPQPPRKESTPVPRRERPSSTGPTGPMSTVPQRRVPLVAPPSIPPMPLPEPVMTAAAPGPLTPPVGLPKPVIEPVDPNLSFRPRGAASSPVDLGAGGDAARKNDDLELDIEEPSRVISLGMLAAQRRQAEAAAVSGPALPGMARNPDAAPVEAAKPDDDGERADLAPPDESAFASAPPRRRSYLTVILSAVAVLALAAAALAFMALGDSKDKSATAGAGGRVSDDFENLGFQIDRPDRGPGPANDTPKQPVDGDEPDKGASTRTDKRSGSSSSARRGDDRSGTNTKSATQPVDAGAVTQSGNTGPLSPLSPDDVIRQSNRSQISFKRCYERARKKDPFLEVRSLNISVNIDAAGQVTNVALDKMNDSYLGECLKATVKRWKLPASTEGISTRISLEFER